MEASPPRTVIHTNMGAAAMESKASDERRGGDEAYDTPMLPKFKKSPKKNKSKAKLRKGSVYPLRGKVRTEGTTSPTGELTNRKRMSQAFVSLLPTPKAESPKRLALREGGEGRPLILGSEGFAQFFERGKGGNRSVLRLKVAPAELNTVQDA